MSCIKTDLLHTMSTLLRTTLWHYCVLVDCTRCSETCSECFVQLFEAWTWLVCMLACLRLCVTSQLSRAALTKNTHRTILYFLYRYYVLWRTFWFNISIHTNFNSCVYGIVGCNPEMFIINCTFWRKALGKTEMAWLQHEPFLNHTHSQPSHLQYALVTHALAF